MADGSMPPQSPFHERLESPTSIRLMKLLPVDSDKAEMECHLITVNLDDCPHYDAISYVWGVESDKKTIICNGQPLAIPRNLFACLRSMQTLGIWRCSWGQSLLRTPQNAKNTDDGGVNEQPMQGLGPITVRLSLPSQKDCVYSRLLWVDSICINQTDNDEKNHQVRIMGRIFNSACMVVIWLGEQMVPDALKLFVSLTGFASF